MFLSKHRLRAFLTMPYLSTNMTSSFTISSGLYLQAEVKLEAVRAKYEEAKLRVRELRTREGVPATGPPASAAKPATLPEARGPAQIPGDSSPAPPVREHITSPAVNTIFSPSPDSTRASALRGSRGSMGAPAPWPLHPGVAASAVSTSFQVFENPGYSPSSSGGGVSQRRRSSSGAIRVRTLSHPVSSRTVGPSRSPLCPCLCRSTSLGHLRGSIRPNPPMSVGSQTWGFLKSRCVITVLHGIVVPFSVFLAEAERGAWRRPT